MSTTIRWLIRDTFRQSLAYGIFWILLAVSVVTIGVCLSVRIEGAHALAAAGDKPDFLPQSDPDAHDAAKLKQSGVAVVGGELTMAFGAIRIPLGRDDRHAVHFVQLLLAGGVADTLGLLLTLIWTAGFLPGFLDGRSVSVLLAKPAPRWLLLVGKYIGVLTFVLFHATLFVGGTWLAIGLRTGIWDAAYLYAIPLLLLHFAVFFSVSLLLAVCTRSTVVCVFGSILFWCIAWGMNYGRNVLEASAAHAGRPLFLVDRFSRRSGLLDFAQAGRFRDAALRRARRQDLFRLGVRYPRALGPRLLDRALRAHVAGLHGLHPGRLGP